MPESESGCGAGQENNNTKQERERIEKWAGNKVRCRLENSNLMQLRELIRGAYWAERPKLGRRSTERNLQVIAGSKQHRSLKCKMKVNE